MGLSLGRRATLESKGWKGVRDLVDPYSIPATYLARARNVYLPEPGSGVGAYARPGFGLKNDGAQINAGGYGQGIVTARTSDGTAYNFFACGGKLYRANAGFTAYTDVTPAGISIDTSARVYLTPFSNRLVVNDGVNTPWVADVLGGTVTGTKIDYTGDGVAWVAYGPAVVYQDCLFFVVRSRNNGGTPQTRTSRIGWSKVDDPFIGYHQTDFDFEWDLIQNGTEPIYALWATNLALYYFRNDSIGYAAGDVGPDFKTTATHDAVDFAIGTRAPASFASFGNSLYFVDVEGRPQRLTAGQGLDTPAPWKQLRRLVPNANSAFPTYTAATAVSSVVPELDLVVMAIYAPDVTVGAHQYPTVLYAFDAASGRYVGEWTVADGIVIHAIGTVLDSNGQTRLAVLGTRVGQPALQPAGQGGYVWILRPLSDGIWTDGGGSIVDRVPDIFITTAPLGYQADTMLSIDRVVAIVSEQTGDTNPKTIEITPTTVAIGIGDTQQYTAIVRNAAGGVLDLEPDVWVSSAPSKATIDATGMATGVAAGTTNITASLSLYGLTSNTAVLTVVDITVPTTIEVTPTSATINVAFTQQLTAVVKNGLGNVLVGFPIDSWNSSDATKATVDGTGLVTGVAAGSTNVTAHINVPSVTSNASAITVQDAYVIHTFTINDTFIVGSGSGNVDALIVGGGGGGGGCTGSGVGCGGGGAGGVIDTQALGTPIAVNPGNYPVTVGKGGGGGRPDISPAPTIQDGGPGSNSVFAGLTAHGGGQGAAVLAGASGGSGGGGRGDEANASNAGGSGTAGQGQNGGSGIGASGSLAMGGGGGGASTAGNTASNGHGGDGVSSSIPHTPAIFGGGGGGSASRILSGGAAGGQGGGGAGNGQPGLGGGDGAAGTGGGGGGGGGDSSGFGGTPLKGGDGGDGVVVIRYKVSTHIVATGGTSKVTYTS